MAFILATAITLSPMADVPQDDQRLFAQILSAEAGHDWEYEGYMLLAHAVMNQIGTEGNTLREVLTKPGNFTVYENGRYLSVPVTTRAELAVRLVMAGITAHDHGQRYFCTDWHWPVSWHKTRPEVAQYKNVLFFK